MGHLHRYDPAFFYGVKTNRQGGRNVQYPLDQTQGMIFVSDPNFSKVRFFFKGEYRYEIDGYISAINRNRVLAVGVNGATAWVRFYKIGIDTAELLGEVSVPKNGSTYTRINRIELDSQGNVVLSLYQTLSSSALISICGLAQDGTVLFNETNGNGYANNRTFFNSIVTTLDGFSYWCARSTVLPGGLLVQKRDLEGELVSETKLEILSTDEIGMASVIDKRREFLFTDIRRVSGTRELVKIDLSTLSPVAYLDMGSDTITIEHSAISLDDEYIYYGLGNGNIYRCTHDLTGNELIFQVEGGHPVDTVYADQFGNIYVAYGYTIGLTEYTKVLLVRSNGDQIEVANRSGNNLKGSFDPGCRSLAPRPFPNPTPLPVPVIENVIVGEDNVRVTLEEITEVIVKSYKWYVDGEFVASTKVPEYTFEGLVIGQGYEVTIQITDNLMNSSELSEPTVISLVEPNRYWRLKINSNNGDANFVGTIEFELYDEEGGTKFSHQEGVIVTSPVYVEDLAKVNDGDINTGAKAYKKGYPLYIQYEMPNPIEVGYYGVGAWVNATGLAARSPRDWELQKSNDGELWETVHTALDQEGWARWQIRRFTIE